MIYLFAKIFVYLLGALAIGAAAGWLWRNQQLAARETETAHALLEGRGGVPRRTAASRSRNQRLDAVLAELAARETELAEQARLLSARELEVAELRFACEDLRDQLTSAAAGSASPAGAGGGELAAIREELDRTRRALTVEQRRVQELSQERELQKRSLEALEQQLDLAREGQARVASR